ncbi:AMP-binding protein, partial [Nocardia gipuzkoensis]
MSHAGRIESGDFAGPEFTPARVLAIPAHTGLAPISFAIVETGNTTEITVSCRNGRGVAEQLEALLDTITATLREPNPPRNPPVSRSETLVEVLREQVAARPEALAVTGPDGSLTYAQLGERSAAIAAALRERHRVGRGDIVAVLADRTIAGLAGQCGILESGAAFLPLDAKHPRDRIVRTLRDSSARLCLVERRHAEIVGDATTVAVLEDLPRSGSAATDPGASPDDIAYVTYTSGSTGHPKGKS